MTVPSLLIWLNVLLIAVEAAVIAYLPGAFFSKRRGALFFGTSFLGLIMLLTLNAFLLEAYTFFRILISIVLSTIWIRLNFSGKLINVFFAAVFIASYLAILDTAFIAIFLRYAHGDVSLLDDPKAYYFLCYTAKMLELMGAVLICTTAKRISHRIPWDLSNWLRLLFIPASTLFVALFLSRLLLRAPEMASDLLGCSIILLVADLLSIVLMNYLEKQQALALENTVLHQNLKYESEHIRSIQEAYALQRKQTHDFNNHLVILRGMAEQKVPESEFADYLGKVLSLETPTFIYFNTHRSVIDVILSQKSSIAKANDIAFDIQLDDLSSFPLSDDALVIVLTNLLDNAIDACKKIDDSATRRIRLKMLLHETAGNLYIENTTAEPVIIRDNHIVTTKADSFAHGYGLKNVIYTLDEYGGMYAMRYMVDKGIFCFSARIPRDHK